MTRMFRLSWGAQALTIGTLACLTAFVSPLAARAQTRTPNTGLSTGSSVLTATPDVHFDQKVNTAVPVDLPFLDETGKSIMLRDYITGKQPVILMLPFYKCAGACTLEQQGLMTALNSVKYMPGKDFQVVMVSINPKETPTLAQAKKTEYTAALTRKESTDGIHYLTGTHDNIRKLADTIGFRYVENLQTEQFGHATGFVVLTPGGKTFRYFYGSDYNPRDIKLALTEAGENKLGSVVDQLMILCYHYDPTTGKYGFLVWRVSQILGIATVLILAVSIAMMLRWEKRHMIYPGADVK
jgi:protein SCO1/2